MRPGQHLLVPAEVFPKEKVPPRYNGWFAAVLGASAGREGCVDVRFPGDPSLYYFSEEQAQQWAVPPGTELATAAAEALAGVRLPSPAAASSGRRTPGRTNAPRAAPAAATGAAAAAAAIEVASMTASPAPSKPSPRKSAAGRPPAAASASKPSKAEAAKRKAERPPDGADRSPVDPANDGVAARAPRARVGDGQAEQGAGWGMFSLRAYLYLCLHCILPSFPRPINAF
jgi:hypothetical protein